MGEGRKTGAVGGAARAAAGANGRDAPNPAGIRRQRGARGGGGARRHRLLEQWRARPLCVAVVAGGGRKCGRERMTGGTSISLTLRSNAVCFVCHVITYNGTQRSGRATNDSNRAISVFCKLSPQYRRVFAHKKKEAIAFFFL